MKKYLLINSLFFIFGNMFAQVGVNNVNPRATLDVTAINVNGTSAEGIIPPRMTGDQIRSANAQYTTLQTGAVVYATAGITSADATGKTSIITNPGMYFFNGTIWQTVAQFAGSALFTASLGSGAGAQINATIPSNGFNTVRLPTVTINIGGGVWNSTNFTYAVPFSGTYLIKSSVRLTDGSASRNLFQAVHTSNQDIADGIWQTNSGTRFTMLYTRIAYLHAGALLRLYIYSETIAANLSDASLNIVLLSQN